MLKSERREFMKITAIYQLAAQNAGSRGVRESVSIRRLLGWKSSVRMARRQARPL